MPAQEGMRGRGMSPEGEQSESKMPQPQIGYRKVK